MTAVAEILAAYDDEKGKPGRLVGRLPNGEYALFERKATGVAEQIGRSTSLPDALAVASAALDRDPRALTWPHTVHVLALALVGAAWSKRAPEGEGS